MATVAPTCRPCFHLAFPCSYLDRAVELHQLSMVPVVLLRLALLLGAKGWLRARGQGNAGVPTPNPLALVEPLQEDFGARLEDLMLAVLVGLLALVAAVRSRRRAPPPPLAMM